MNKINIKNIVLCFVLIVPLKVAIHFFLFKEVVVSSMTRRSRSVDSANAYYDLPMSEWKYHNFEYHYNRAFIDDLHIYVFLSIAMIFIMWYFNLYLKKRKNVDEKKDVNWKYEDFSDSNEKKINSWRWLSFVTWTTRKKALRNILLLLALAIPFLYITTFIATQNLGINYELWDSAIVGGFSIWIIFVLINLYKLIVGDNLKNKK